MDNFDGEVPKRNPVFCSRVGAVLDLDRDDLGHPAHPGLWRQLLADRRPVEQRGLYCPDCLASRPERPEWMYVYERGGLRIAAHHNPARRHHDIESDAHQAYRDRYARAAESDGHRVEVAPVGGDGRRRPEVLVTGAGGRRYGFRPQLSYLAAGTARARDAAARAAGITAVWHTVDAGAPLIDAVHWTRTDNLPAAAIRDNRDLLVRGGVRALALERCDRRPGPCSRRGSGNCGHRHPRWDPMPRQFDDLVRDIASGAYVPLTVRTGRGLHRFWACAADREAFLDNGGLLADLEFDAELDAEFDAEAGPGAGPGARPGASPGAETRVGSGGDVQAGHATTGLGTVPRQRHTSLRRRREVQCVLDRVERGHRRLDALPPRDTGEPLRLPPAPARPATVPPVPAQPATVPSAAPARPQRPPIAPLRPHVCSAGTTPCGAPARPYAGGWFCEEHRPGPGFGRPGP
ncbi:hypothetical protein J5Y04_32545 [Kitasatospora sp. RG8]|uniref:hypothetical protein n=1 Tax=Kitasatospora sp. RG8 TaxID=2820815 RepID=UPI001ADFE7B6|nr:hypothetical protein [Kitasatospora sp. RG8]MBP0454228.1 hypothetical protein [Kitasatospora sp. RG8]